MMNSKNLQAFLGKVFEIPKIIWNPKVLCRQTVWLLSLWAPQGTKEQRAVSCSFLPGRWPWKPVVGLGVACCRPSTPISPAVTQDSRLRTWRSGVEQVGANILLTSSVDGLPSVPTAVADLHMLGLLHEAH